MEENFDKGLREGAGLPSVSGEELMIMVETMTPEQLKDAVVKMIERMPEDMGQLLSEITG